MRRLVPLGVVAAALVAAPVAHAKPHPASAADVARAWIRDWSRGQETAACSVVAKPLLKQMALASGTPARSAEATAPEHADVPDASAICFSSGLATTEHAAVS